jgi:hypothetical protein
VDADGARRRRRGGIIEPGDIEKDAWAVAQRDQLDATFTEHGAEIDAAGEELAEAVVNYFERMYDFGLPVSFAFGGICGLSHRVAAVLEGREDA